MKYVILEKGRGPDKKPRKKRAQWHEDFKTKHGRYPNQFEVFMNTAAKNLEGKNK